MRVRAPVKTFFFFFWLSQRCRKVSCFSYLQKKACFDVLCTCKATSLSKMAKLVWRYSDDAGAIIETVYKFCMPREEKKSGKNLSLNHVWDRTVALTGVSKSTAQKIRKEKKKAQHQQQQLKQRRKCPWMTLTRVLYRGPSPACTP